jgi:hypothetical protein
MELASYLHAKKTVDDRALNPRVKAAFLNAFPVDGHVVELGAGIGTMLERLPAVRRYTCVDRSADALAQVSGAETWCGDAAAFLEQCEPFDACVANAFLDLVDLDTFLPRLFAKLKGPFWFTINFDGDSIFEPADPHDAAIWTPYHASMDAREGSSHTGRQLLTAIPRHGARIEAAGSSDWVVLPPYPALEAAFLHNIVDTVENELAGLDVLDGWVTRRRAQIEGEELVYIAHQLDVFGIA